MPLAWRVIAAILYIAIVNITNPAVAGEVAFRAPVKCKGAPSCGDDLSLDEAKRSYEEIIAWQSECLQRSRNKIKRNGDEAGDCPQLESLTDHNVCASAETQGLYYYWAPADRLPDGHAALAKLLHRARVWHPSNGYVIVESDDSTTTEHHLALCRVSQVSEAVGPPLECVTVAIITPTETWLRGGNRRQPGCFFMGSFRNTGAIDISFEVLTKASLLPFSAALLNTLKFDLDLSTEQQVSKGIDGKVYAVYLKAAGSLRDSKILQEGWREALDFDLYLLSSEDGISIRGVAHALVSRQALGSVVNYQGPDDAQRAAYASALDSRINAAIKAVCKNYQQHDAKNISCD